MAYGEGVNYDSGACAASERILGRSCNVDTCLS